MAGYGEDRTPRHLLLSRSVPSAQHEDGSPRLDLHLPQVVIERHGAADHRRRIARLDDLFHQKVHHRGRSAPIPYRREPRESWTHSVL
jgi:hypothetical protein